MGTKNNPSDFDCYEAAEPDEPMFVLLARDPHAGYLVRAWAALRQGNLTDAMRAFLGAMLVEKRSSPNKVAEAHRCATDMRLWRYYKMKLERELNE